MSLIQSKIKNKHQALETVGKFCARLEMSALHEGARRAVLWFSLMQNLPKLLNERKEVLELEWMDLAKDVVGEMVVCLMRYVAGVQNVL